MLYKMFFKFLTIGGAKYLVKRMIQVNGFKWKRLERLCWWGESDTEFEVERKVWSVERSRLRNPTGVVSEVRQGEIYSLLGYSKAPESLWVGQLLKAQLVVDIQLHDLGALIWAQR